MKTKIIVVAGPTAVGKSAFGIHIAQRFNGEIISGDSQQVYTELNIGTAKVDTVEQAQAKHHLINVRSVAESYSAYDFVQEANQKIQEIASRGKVPIIVGGTGLYLQSLLEGYHLGGEVDQSALLAYRLELEELSDEELFRAVSKAGLSISQINRRRAIRALELAKFGKNLINQKEPYEAYVIGLNEERPVLYERINQRVDQMMEAGLLEEAAWLYQHYPDSQASKGIGYKEFFPYFKGEITLDEAVATVKQHTRQFAKRQLTWFRNRMHIAFYNLSSSDVKKQVLTFIEEFLDD